MSGPSDWPFRTVRHGLDVADWLDPADLEEFDSASAVIPDIRGLLTTLTDRFREPLRHASAGRPCYIGYTFSRALGFEVALTEGGRIALAIDACVPLTLISVFSSLLERGYVLADGGTALRADREAPLYRYDGEIGRLVAVVGRSQRSPTIEADDPRDALLGVMLNVTLNFMIAHELAHVEKGDLLHLPTSPRQKRARELWADILGARRALGELGEQSRTDVQLLRSLRLWAFTIGIFFAVAERFENDQIARGQLRRSVFGGDYPRAALRARTACWYLRLMASEHSGTRSDSGMDGVSQRLFEALDQGLVEAWAAIDSIGWGPVDRPDDDELDALVQDLLTLE